MDNNDYEKSLFMIVMSNNTLEAMTKQQIYHKKKQRKVSRKG